MAYRIFISYRRADSGPYCDLVYNRLVAVFGEPHVYRDVVKTIHGIDFRQQIRDAIGQSLVVIALIGPHYAIDQSGHNRLNDPDDMVCYEAQQALDQKKSSYQCLWGV